MKRGWKIFWIIILTAAGIGIALCGVSLAMGVTLSQIREVYPRGVGVFEEAAADRESEDLSELPSEGEIYEFQDITSLEMSIGMCDVEILPSEDDKVRVDTTECWFGNDSGILVQEEAGKLLIKSVEGGKLQNVLSLITDDRDGELTVYLPENLNLDIAELTFGAANVEIEVLKAGEVVLKVGAADCTVNNMDIGTMQADVGAGDAELRGRLQGDLSVKSGAGDIEIELYGKESDYNYSVKSGAGTVRVGDWEYDGLAGTRDIDNGSSRNIDIVCGAGDVEVEFYDR